MNQKEQAKCIKEGENRLRGDHRLNVEEFCSRFPLGHNIMS